MFSGVKDAVDSILKETFLGTLGQKLAVFRSLSLRLCELVLNYCSYIFFLDINAGKILVF